MLMTGFVRGSPFRKLWLKKGNTEAQAYNPWWGFARCVKCRFAGLTAFHLSYVNLGPSVLGGESVFRVKLPTNANPYVFTEEEDVLAFLKKEGLLKAFTDLEKMWLQRIPPGIWHELERPKSVHTS